ncbi:MAG: cytidylate kinase family protein [Candidatus Bilamarchaeaceae archaeon]
MIIAVWGLTGAGKNTLGALIAKRLGYRLVCPTFKDLAAKEGISLMDLQRRAEKDKSIDLKFDSLLREEATKGDCVVTTWLGPWIVNADVKIKINVPLEIRAQRIAKRDGMSIKDALEHVRERDESNRKRYLSLYKIDITDESIFDAVLDGKKPPEELLKDSLKIIKMKQRKSNCVETR